MNEKFALVLDLGTTEVKTLVFNSKRQVVADSQKTLTKNVDGERVEQDPKEILEAAKHTLKDAAIKAKLDAENCSGFGITNQRETVIVWDKTTGEPIYSAIVWQDTRTRKHCAEVSEQFGQKIQSATGLPTDPYFSASKVEWILKNFSAETEKLLFGTVDTWVMWNLLENRPHLTDFTNASRTLLFNILTKSWDQELLDIWSVPKSLLPETRHSISNFGSLDRALLGFPLPLRAVCGDQQASMYAARKLGADTKVTYGTGTFLMQELGDEFELCENFFTTLTPRKDRPIFAIESKIGSFGNRVAEALSRGEKLDTLIDEMAPQVSAAINKLPRRPAKIILDGGITQSPLLLPKQSSLNSEIEFQLQTPYNGTALGVALMVFDSIN